MNDDDLKELWQNQPLRDAPSTAQLVSALQNRTGRLRRSLDARDLRELMACAFVIIAFGFFYFFLDVRWPISRVGDLIVIGSALFIAWKLLHARRSNPPARPGATVIEGFRAELKAVRAQSRLLGSVAWWYLLPLAIGIFVCTWGRGSGLIYNIAYSVCVIALYAFIYHLNRRARDQHLLPLEAQLQSLLHSAETGEPPDDVRLSNLRPVILSLAAADRVKPVEFKVSFWQIALWGEIGFMGIWFCLVLALAVGKLGTSPPSRDTLAQTVPAAETNRYTPVAKTIIGLLNAHDYGGEEKLYSPEMRSAFPLEKTFNFNKKLVADFGRIRKLEGPIGQGHRGWIAYRLHCEQGELTMSLALDADDRISGIYFQPTLSAFRSTGSVVFDILSWRHLLWLVGFFLAGLGYSWLLQKWTERAVGISTLGIHFHKGQDLLLWEEIKQVRPLRIVNIRSLWLIRESHEKTLIPWSSLERHAELKAAVESFAPPGHPVRTCLSLLK